MKKEEIFEKIEVLFFDKTFKQVSMQDIALFLWIKKPSLYYYFSSKEVLFDELIDYSFLNYKKNILKLIEKNLDLFIKEFISYPQKTKNLFSLINQTWYCDNDILKEKLKTKNKDLFLIISESFYKKYWFEKEKTFLFLNMLESLAKKDCLFWKCEFEDKDIFKEITKLFIS